MKKYKWIIVIAVVLVIAAIGFGTYFFLTQKKPVLGTKSVYFGMSEQALQETMGDPLERSVCDEESEYVYAEEWKGWKMNCHYYFLNIGQNRGLYRFSVTMEELVPKDAKVLVEQIHTQVQENYSYNLDFYDGGIQNEGESFTLNMGIDNGVTGIYYCVAYDGKQMEISAADMR